MSYIRLIDRAKTAEQLRDELYRAARGDVDVYLEVESLVGTWYVQSVSDPEVGYEPISHASIATGVLGVVPDDIDRVRTHESVKVSTLEWVDCEKKPDVYLDVHGSKHANTDPTKKYQFLPEKTLEITARDLLLEDVAPTLSPRKENTHLLMIAVLAEELAKRDRNLWHGTQPNQAGLAALIRKSLSDFFPKTPPRGMGSSNIRDILRQAEKRLHKDSND